LKPFLGKKRNSKFLSEQFLNLEHFNILIRKIDENLWKFHQFPISKANFFFKIDKNLFCQFYLSPINMAIKHFWMTEWWILPKQTKKKLEEDITFKIEEYSKLFRKELNKNLSKVLWNSYKKINITLHQGRILKP